MAALPTYDDWMRDTKAFGRSRSTFLQAVDEAIRKGDKLAIKTALDRWRFEQSRQGKDWKESVRNQKGAVTKLHRTVADLDQRNLSKEELEALEYISHAQAMALMKQFQGRQLAFKSSTLAGMAQRAGTRWQQFKTGATSVKSGYDTGKEFHGAAQDIHKGVDLLKTGGHAAAQTSAQADMAGKFASIRVQIIAFCRELCPGLDPNEVFSALRLGHVEQFATDLAPFVGAISSGGKAVKGWVDVAQTGWRKHSTENARYAFAPGDPEAAFDAVKELIQRELISKSAQASTATVAFTGKALGAFADAGAVTGPVFGLLETLAGIFQQIVEYVRDYKECQAANEHLRMGALNLEIFQVSPILGCYFLLVQDHSTIINFAVGEYGTPNWMFDCEKLVAKVNPVLDTAREYVNASRLEIPGMESQKGIADKKGIKDKLMDRIDAWFEKPERPPKPVVDKSRIVGFGSGTV